ncbi:MAG: heparinase II/III family protein, partial [Niabella sp.]|nr:heparinase II/III family protein [Niabella sp.]
PNRIADEVTFFSLLNLDLRQLSEVKKAVQKKNWAMAKNAWARYLAKRKQPVWLWSAENHEAIRKVFEENYGGSSRYESAARNILARKFSFNGVTKILPYNFQWRTGSPIWEQLFSRHDWLVQLGYAYVLTGKSNYARDFTILMRSWVDQHPVLPDVTKTWNGTDKAWMSLEIGLRMQNWMDLFEAFRNAPEFDAATCYLMTRSMVEQIRYLDGWVVHYRVGNWQMAEATGMACVGIMFPEFKDAIAWRTKAFTFLTAHMQKDVYDDGTHIEVTPNYHAGVAEEYTKIERLIRVNGYDSLTGVVSKHEKMFDFLMDITQPDKRCPLIGDAGRSDLQEISAVGALEYNRKDLRWLGSKKLPEAWVWVFGANAVSQYNRIPSIEPSIRSVLLPDSKYAVMRTGWNNADKYLLFDCAPSLGSHSHGDRLQVIAYAGRSFLVDPGQYSYAEPLADYFKTAQVHNILRVDSAEQPKVDPTLQAWYVGKHIEYVSGKLQAGEYTHQRTVVFVKPFYWVIVDHVKSRKNHMYTRQFQFPVGAPVTPYDKGFITNYATGTNLFICPAEKTQAALKNRPLPVNANHTSEAVQACFYKNSDTTIFATVLFPFTSIKELPVVEKVYANKDLIKIKITFPDRKTDQIVVSDNPETLETNGIKKEGIILCTENETNGNVQVID